MENAPIEQPSAVRNARYACARTRQPDRSHHRRDLPRSSSRRAPEAPGTYPNNCDSIPSPAMREACAASLRPFQGDPRSFFAAKRIDADDKTVPPGSGGKPCGR